MNNDKNATMDENKTELKFNKTGKVITGVKDKNVKSIVIPDGVTKIGGLLGAFRNCTSLNSIKIPKSVTGIGHFAFWGCTSLATIEIPNSVTEISSAPFYGCKSLKAIVVDKNNPKYVSIDGVLYNKDCTCLIVYPADKGETSFKIPKSVTKIMPGAFSCCTSLVSIEIPNSVTEIGWEAFYGCSSLFSIKLPNSVTEIESGVFSGCSSLKTIGIDKKNPLYAELDGVLYNKDFTRLLAYPGGKDDIFEVPDSVIEIESEAFKGCTSTDAIVIYNNVKLIGDSCFEDCNGDIILNFLPTDKLSETFDGFLGYIDIDIPSGITEIEEGSFSGCTSIRFISLPNSVTKIGYKAFSGCTSLCYVDIPDSVTEIRHYAFEGCKSLSLIKIPNSVKTIECSTFNGCSSFTSIEIPNSVTEIGSYAFSGCSSLESIRISKSVIKIEYGVFEGCTSLESIKVDKNNSVFADIDGVLHNKKCTRIIAYPMGKKACTYQISNNVIQIENGAFSDCKFLTTIEIPDSVNEIGWYAFARCTSLTAIRIPIGVIKIENYLFYGCTSLNSIMIPNKLTIIGSKAFSGCESLLSIEVPDSVNLIINDAFDKCGLNEIHIIQKNPEEIAIWNLQADDLKAPMEIQDCILYVPIGTDYAYRQDYRFKNFKEIKTEK